jgi:4-amino-4-deoxy-L-arabinose transferase-like glycosyltransferase
MTETCEKKLFAGWLVVVTVIYLALVIYAAPDVRGDDQYWYLADVETLLAGGPNVTNNVYPTQILRDDLLTPQPFIHHIPNLYFVLPAAKLFGAHAGWIVANVVATTLGAGLVAWLALRLGDRWASTAAYTLYLLLPVTVRQSSQVLAEATIAPFIALSTVTYVLADDKLRLWIATFAAVAIAYWSRMSFAPLLLLIPGAYFFQYGRSNSRGVGASVLLLVCGVMVVLSRGMLVKEGVSAPLSEVFVSAVPHVTDRMSTFFCLSPPPLRAEHLWVKFTTYMRYQFLHPAWRLQLYYLPFNVLAAFSVAYIFLKKTRLQRRLVHCAVTLLLLHLLTIVLIHDSPRYLMVVLPPIAAAAVLCTHRVGPLKSGSVRWWLAAAGAVLLVGANVPLVTSLRANAIRERQVRQSLETALSGRIDASDTVMVEGQPTGYDYILLGYVLRPRTVVMVHEGYTDEQYQTIRARSQADWLMCVSDSHLCELFEASAEPVPVALPSPFERYILLRLR